MKRRDNFAIGFIIYMAVLFLVIMGGLALLWFRMDAYEKSRPDNELKKLVRETDSGYWRRLLVEKGLDEKYVNTIDLESVSFHKKMGFYTDSEPVYGISFGNAEMLLARFRHGEELSFGYNAWEIGDISLSGSGLCVYVPQEAVIRVDGKEIGNEYLAQENAQGLQLGIFDENRENAPHLSKYELNDVYGMEGVTVEDGKGNELEVSYSSGTSYYYAPYTSDYKIIVPAGSEVTVNDILLTKDNAKIETVKNKDFEGIEEYVPFVPEQTAYIIEGLVMPPEVKAAAKDGKELELTAEGTNYIYDIKNTLPGELSNHILNVFDAYTAYLGNRNKNSMANYSRYASYLLPGSEAAERASQAQSSIRYASYVKTKSVNIDSYTPYSDDMFTSRVNFELEKGGETGEVNSYLFIFVKSNGAWKVVRVLNKTAFFG